MNLGNKLLSLRKQKGLSQEEVADNLGVSRQTVSKWETDQSTPDFDKIIPLCELYEITADELLKGETMKKTKEGSESLDDEQLLTKKGKFIGFGVFLYFFATAFFMMSTEVDGYSPINGLVVFLIICGLATYSIIYGNIVYKKKNIKNKKLQSRLFRPIFIIISLLATTIYFVVSFTTFAWHITWLIWIIYAAVVEIVRLIFMLKEEKDEE